MVDDFSRAADTINKGFETIHLLNGKFPKQQIETQVERWYLEMKENHETCANIIEFISKKYQRTAINHLNYIHQYGYVHLKSKKKIEYKTNVIECYFMGLIMVWPAIAGIFMMFSEDEEDKKQAFPSLLAILTWVIFLTWIMS